MKRFLNRERFLNLKSEVPKVFDSGLNIVEPTILVPHCINSVIRAIQKKVDRNEFSILLKGAWTENGFALSRDFYIPKQEVSATSVDYKEDLSVLQKEGWNTIYHSHPFSHIDVSFSHADIESINCHFSCSLLGNDEGIKRASLSFYIDIVIVQVPAVVIIEEDLPTIDIDTSNIEYMPIGLGLCLWKGGER